MASTGSHAQPSNVPVLVAAETYKFHERVQLDAVTANELGDPAALRAGARGGDAAAGHPNLTLLNLVYDATPAEAVSVVVTEVGLLPPTSVPAVLRELWASAAAGAG